MDQFLEILSDEVKKKGKSKSAVAEKLGISSQLLGQYLNGRHKPKQPFYDKWKEVFNEDLQTIIKHRTSKKGLAIDLDKESMAKEIVHLKALTKAILHAYAKLLAEATGQEADKIVKGVLVDTKLIMNDPEG